MKGNHLQCAVEKRYFGVEDVKREQADCKSNNSNNDKKPRPISHLEFSMQFVVNKAAENLK